VIKIFDIYLSEERRSNHKKSEKPFDKNIKPIKKGERRT